MKATGWKPTTSFAEMISEMMETDLKEASRELKLKKRVENKN